MTKPDLDDLAEELAEAQHPGRWRRLTNWLGDLARQLAWLLAISAVGGLTLHAVGLDAHLVIRGFVLASPVIAGGLAIFVRSMWAQNWVAEPIETGQVDAEPASQPDLANEPDLASQPQPTIQVTVHSLPTPAELPAALTAARAVGDYQYATREDRDGDQ